MVTGHDKLEERNTLAHTIHTPRHDNMHVIHPNVTHIIIPNLKIDLMIDGWNNLGGTVLISSLENISKSFTHFYFSLLNHQTNFVTGHGHIRCQTLRPISNQIKLAAYIQKKIISPI